MIISCSLVLTSLSVARASTISTFDVLVATDNLTVVGTATVQGNAFSVGNSTFVIKHGFVGIGTRDPITQLHVSTFQTRFQWSSGTIRSGQADGTQWDAANVGMLSAAFGFNNQASGDYSFIGGGASNWVKVNYNHSAIVAGASNIIHSGHDAFIGGGIFNSISNGFYSAVVAGQDNGVSANWAIVGGGSDNVASGVGAVVAGGGVLSNGTGVGNQASGASAAVLGGVSNQASGNYSVVPGGQGNTASGTFSFAAGQSASAQGQGSFVWADSQSGSFVSSNNDEFKIRSQGGIVLVGTPSGASPTIIASSGSVLISTSATAASATPNIFISSINGNVGIGRMLPGSVLDVNGAATIRGTLTATSSGTIQGNAFSVGSSTFVVSGGFVGVGTNTPATNLDVAGSARFGPSTGKSTFTASPGGTTYALELSSGITISSGGPINLTSGGFIRYADGSVSTTAATGGGGGGFTAGASTFTRITGSQSTTSTSFTLISGASLTLTMNGGKALIAFNCSVAPVSSGHTSYVAFVANGSYLDGATSSEGHIHAVDQDGGSVRGSGASGTQLMHITESTYTGSNTFWLEYKGTGGTVYVNDNFSTGDRTSICQYGVVEI